MKLKFIDEPGVGVQVIEKNYMPNFPDLLGLRTLSLVLLTLMGAQFVGEIFFPRVFFYAQFVTGLFFLAVYWVFMLDVLRHEGTVKTRYLWLAGLVIFPELVVFVYAFFRRSRGVWVGRVVGGADRIDYMAACVLLIVAMGILLAVALAGVTQAFYIPPRVEALSLAGESPPLIGMMVLDAYQWVVGSDLGLLLFQGGGGW